MQLFQIKFQCFNEIVKWIFCLARRTVETDKGRCFVASFHLKVNTFLLEDILQKFLIKDTNFYYKSQ